MNYIFYLPLDLQRLLARYLIPVIWEPNFTKVYCPYSRDKQEEFRELFHSSSSILVYQELTQRSFPSLLAWDLGSSVIQRNLIGKEISSLYLYFTARSSEERNIGIMLCLGLRDKYEQIRSQINHYSIQSEVAEMSLEMYIYLLDRGGTKLTEHGALRHHSIPLLQRYQEESGNSLILTRLISRLRYDPHCQDILDYYLTHVGKVTLKDFRDLFSTYIREKRRIRVSLLQIEKLDLTWKNETHLVCLIYCFVNHSPIQPASDYQLLEELIAQTRTRLPETTWHRVFGTCLRKLYQLTDPVDPLIHYVFWRLYLTTPVNQVSYRKYRKALSCLPDYSTILPVLQPLFDRT